MQKYKNVAGYNLLNYISYKIPPCGFLLQLFMLKFVKKVFKNGGVITDKNVYLYFCNLIPGYEQNIY